MSTGFSILGILGILACLASGLLPLGLGAGIGALQKQKSGAAGALAGYGAPVALVLTLAALIVGRKGMIPSFYPHLVFAAALGIAGAGSAIFLAFCPKKAGFACAAFVGIAGFGTAALGFLEEGGPAALSGLVSYGLALLFSGMGLAQGNAALRKQEAAGAQEQPGTPVGSGGIFVLPAPYEGVWIPVEEGEELRLGSDVARCHLIFDLPGMPACLCSVRWLGLRDTYLVTGYATGGLLDEEGQSLPVNGSAEARPGQRFFFGATGEELFRIGR